MQHYRTPTDLLEFFKGAKHWEQVRSCTLTLVSIVVPCFGLPNSIPWILQGNPPKKINYNGDYLFSQTLQNSRL